MTCPAQMGLKVSSLRDNCLEKRTDKVKTKSSKNTDVNFRNDISNVYTLTKNKKRHYLKSEASEEIDHAGTYPENLTKTHENLGNYNDVDKSHKDSFDKISAYGSMNFESKNHLVPDRYHVQNAKDIYKINSKISNDLISKKFSVKTDFSDRDNMMRAASASYKKIRDRQVLSPCSIKSNNDEVIEMNSFSCRTIEGDISSKKTLLNEKHDIKDYDNDFYKIESKSQLKDSTKQVKAALMRYSNNERKITPNYEKNKKNLSYCSNENEKSISSKKRNSVSGNESLLRSSAKRKKKVSHITKDKMRSISSASSNKSIPGIKKSNNDNHETPLDFRKEIEFDTDQEQLDELKKSIIEADKKIEENKHPNSKKAPFVIQCGLQNSKGMINDTLSSIYSTVEENSVCNKRHDISVVEADGILEQINSRMMKLHFEMIYKNLDKDDGKVEDFSFEIDNTNNMIVPKNSNDPIKQKKFVQLPYNEDLYKEMENSSGKLQWVADTQTIRIFSQSPKRDKE